MSVIRGVAFWLMMTMMWLLLTPPLVYFINQINLSGIEGFLMDILPWTVLLALIIKVISSLQQGDATI